MWLTRFSINRPVIVAMAAVALAVFGIRSYLSLGVSLFPNVAFPVVIVDAEYPGAAPSTMEKLVVKPIEDSVQGLENLDKVTATAQEGQGIVVVQFKLDTDLNYAATQVQQAVDAARVNMPTDLNPPLVFKATSNSGSILDEAVTSKTMSAAALGDLVQNEIKPDLTAVPGVVRVDVSGDTARELDVYPDYARLDSVGGTLLDIFNSIAPNNSTLPGGRVDSPTKETTVAVHAEINKATDMLAFPVPIPGTGLRPQLGQLATVADTHAEQRFPTQINGQTAVVIGPERAVGADEIKTTTAIRAEFKKLAERYPQLHFREIDANADYTRASINGVLQSLLEGIALTAVVMLLFLHAWRNAAVVMVAIPISLLATFGVMYVFGYTIDLISMMGLGLTIGILVDDSIVVLENITRHRDMGEAPLDAAYSGRTEIGSAALTITMVDVVVFLPIAFLSGVVGKYLKEFGIVIVVATLCSLLVSFTLTPLLAGRWSVKRRSPAVPGWARWFQNGFSWLQHRYVERILPWVLQHRVFTAFLCASLVLTSLFLAGSPRTGAMVDVGLAVLFVPWLLISRLCARFGFARERNLPPARSPLVWTWRWAGGHLRAAVRLAQAKPRDFLASSLLLYGLAGAMFFAPTIGSEFIPSSDSGVISGSVTFPAGTPLAETAKDLTRFSTEALKIPGVNIVQTTGGMKQDSFTSTNGGNVGSFIVFLDKDKRRQTARVLDAVRELGWTFPGATFQAGREGGGGSGTAIAYTLSGPDVALNDAANKLAALIRRQPGAINVQTSVENAAPRLDITIDSARAALLGVTPGDAATTARIAIGGAIPTKVRMDSGLVDVREWLPPDQRNDVGIVKSLKVRAGDGTLVPLAAIANFTFTKAPTKIEREDRQRIIRVTGAVDPQKGTLGSIVQPVDKALAVPGFLPPGVRTKSEGDSQLFEETFASMGWAILTSAALVYMLMVILYGSFLEPFIVMFSIPVAIVGALTALALRHQTFNLFSLLAVVMLFGLVAKNGILLVDYANQMRRRGMGVVEAMQAAAATRFRPILMTTFAMIFGMLPLALGFTEGAEERASMGTVLIGGLLSSLILTLALVPVAFSAIMGFAESFETWRKDRIGRAGPVELPEFEREPVGAGSS
ncbi:MAG: efflux RND transporter permease subunit [Vulcanimicrobiaceae bacterium]